MAFTGFRNLALRNIVGDSAGESVKIEPCCSKGYTFDSGPGVGTGKGSQLRSKRGSGPINTGVSRVSSSHETTVQQDRQSMW